MNNNTRVVVTGIGVISPVGLDVPTMWENIQAGRSGIAPITQFDASGYDVKIAGEAWGFDPLNFLSARDARRMDRFSQFALAALQEALAQSGLRVEDHDPYDIGVIMGSAVSGVATFVQCVDDLRIKGPRRLNPFHATSIAVDSLAVHIALRVGARGPNMGVNSACASGADAIGQAFETIKRGEARAMFTGGFDAGILPLVIAGFDQTGAMSHRNHDPSTASRPFDAERDGFVAAEGGALFLLEDLKFALQRGAQPLVEMLSYAATSDAVHLTAPDCNGAGAARCMALAMRRAGLSPQDVSCINAHGTGTRIGDPAEVRAIRHAFGEHAGRVPVSATKSITGHLMGAAGALEAAISIQSVRTGVLPPTINLDCPDPECDLDFVPLHARRAEARVVMSNSFGFGGHNAALIFSALDQF